MIWNSGFFAADDYIRSTNPSMYISVYLSGPFDYDKNTLLSNRKMNVDPAHRHINIAEFVQK
jgi:hypothetical protein